MKRSIIILAVLSTILLSACAHDRKQKYNDYREAEIKNTKEGWDEYYNKWGKYEERPSQSNTDNESIYYNEFKLKEF
jgi:hypothetical protein